MIVADEVFSVQALHDFVKNINWKEIHDRKRKGDKKAIDQHKSYNEEIIPLNGYIQSKNNSATKINICIKHQSYYDAYITIGTNIIEYIQITCAINNHSYALQKQAIEEQDPLQNKIHDMLADNRENASKAYNKDLTKNEKKAYKEAAKFTGIPVMHSAVDTRNIEIELIEDAINNKIKKAKDQKIEGKRTLLVAYYADGMRQTRQNSDQFVPAEINKLSKYCNDNTDQLIASKFERAVIVNKCYMYYENQPKPEILWSES
jgi:hypothetical protein